MGTYATLEGIIAVEDADGCLRALNTPDDWRETSDTLEDALAVRWSELDGVEKIGPSTYEVDAYGKIGDWWREALDIVAGHGGRGVLYGTCEEFTFRIVIENGEWREESPTLLWPSDTSEMERELRP